MKMRINIYAQKYVLDTGFERPAFGCHSTRLGHLTWPFQTTSFKCKYSHGCNLYWEARKEIS